MSSNYPIPVLNDLSDASIKRRIAAASDRLSWRLARRIESAYSRILEAGQEAEGWHDGSREYFKIENNTFVSGECTAFSVGLVVNSELDAAKTIWLHDNANRKEFTRRALWFWCLLFGHWEYYPKHA